MLLHHWTSRQVNYFGHASPSQMLTSLSVSEWYVPTKEDDGTPCKAEDSLFYLLVRGSSDRPPLSGEYQDSDHTSTLEGDSLSVERTYETGVEAPCSDSDVEDEDPCGMSLPFPSRN